MTDRPTAETLVQTAEQAIDQHHRAHLGEARDAAAALLRELAATSAGYPEYVTTDELITLADQIEEDA